MIENLGDYVNSGIGFVNSTVLLDWLRVLGSAVMDASVGRGGCPPPVAPRSYSH